MSSNVEPTQASLAIPRKCSFSLRGSESLYSGKRWESGIAVTYPGLCQAMELLQVATRLLSVFQSKVFFALAAQLEAFQLISVFHERTDVLFESGSPGE